MLQRLAKDPDAPPGPLRSLQDQSRQADLDYALEEIPKALAETTDGVVRVAAIVRAMKEFAHPEGKDKVSTDLNRIIQNTITVSKNEWKYLADVKTDLEEALPPVLCLPGEIGQVILNLIVNAAQSIGEKNTDGGQGLAIAETIVHKKHQGKILFESQPGVGTTFKILLPLQPAAAD